ncbi:MAG: hypothetical protein BWX71_00593 [Deltaproteobacteria bacterium ADurb.Bin072]|nr:MAG: hypothetical protein BWX71_00593 [Deltaproteobacteria bacterium ADurb.Bin072]
MELVAYLPKELRTSRKAWVLWGVLVEPEVAEKGLDPQTYSLALEAKLAMMVERSRNQGDEPQDLLADHLAESWPRVQKEAVVEQALMMDELAGPEMDLLMYLQGQVGLDHLELGRDREDLSAEEQDDLVRNLDLRTYLEYLP